MLAFLKAGAARYASHPLAIPVMALYGFIGTIVEIVPVTWVLSAFVALNPKRWKRFLAAGVLGASVGAVLLTWIFHRWGLAWIVAHYPSLVNSSGWQSAEVWIAQYGIFVLVVIAASPLALTPALAACGLMKMPLASAGLAVLFGKLAKYSIVASIARKAGLASKNFSVKI